MPNWPATEIETILRPLVIYNEEAGLKSWISKNPKSEITHSVIQNWASISDFDPKLLNWLNAFMRENESIGGGAVQALIELDASEVNIRLAKNWADAHAKESSNDLLIAISKRLPNDEAFEWIYSKISKKPSESNYLLFHSLSQINSKRSKTVIKQWLENKIGSPHTASIATTLTIMLQEDELDQWITDLSNALTKENCDPDWGGVIHLLLKRKQSDNVIKLARSWIESRQGLYPTHLILEMLKFDLISVQEVLDWTQRNSKDPHTGFVMFMILWDKKISIDDTVLKYVLDNEALMVVPAFLNEQIQEHMSKLDAFARSYKNGKFYHHKIIALMLSVLDTMSHKTASYCQEIAFNWLMNHSYGSKDWLEVLSASLYASGEKKETIELAKSWLLKNETHEHYLLILAALLHASDSELFENKALTWFEQNPDYNHVHAAKLLLSLLKNKPNAVKLKHARDLISNRLIDEELVSALAILMEHDESLEYRQIAKRISRCHSTPYRDILLPFLK